MQSKTLNLALAAALTCSLSPVPAFAADQSDAASTTSSDWMDKALDLVQEDADQGEAEGDRASGAKANSWRFTEGYANETLGDAAADAGIETAGAWGDLGPGDLDISSTWTKADGAAAYTVRKTPTGSSERVKVPGSLAVGIDVSAHNNQPGGVPAGAIDWNKVKSEGISFVLIRCGYGSNYTSQDDKWFASNYQGAKAAGLKVGVYLYSYAPKATGGAPSAANEAEHVLRIFKDNGIKPADLALPVYLDLEDKSQENLKKGTLGAIATEFCGKMQAAGYQAGIYANQYWFNEVLKKDSAVFDPATMQKNGWSRWVARYAAKATASGVEATDIWQFTCIGKVEGIPKKYCDVNFAYVDFAPEAPAAPDASTSVPSTPGVPATPSAPSASTTKKPSSAAASATIAYKLNGGKNNAANPKKFTGALTLKSPKRSGYTFGGWYTDKRLTKKVTTLTASQAAKGKFTLYAKWFKNYKITYKLNGGKNNKANPKKYGGTLTLKSPTRAGYTFGGWYTNKKLTKKATTLTVKKNRTVYAKWVKAKKGTYVITSSDGLFIRERATTSSAIKGGLGFNQCVRVVKVSKGWGKLAEGGWINLSYATRVRG